MKTNQILGGVGIIAIAAMIGMGEGLTMLPGVEMAQVGAFTRLMGVLLMAYVTLTYFLPNVRNAVRKYLVADRRIPEPGKGGRR